MQEWLRQISDPSSNGYGIHF